MTNHHTRGEWQVLDTLVLSIDAATPVAMCCGTTTEEAEANARRIAECCNMHEKLLLDISKLVNALRDMQHAFADDVRPGARETAFIRANSLVKT